MKYSAWARYFLKLRYVLMLLHAHSYYDVLLLQLCFFFFYYYYFLGKDYNPCFTKRYTAGYLQYLCTSLSSLTVLFVAVLP